MVEKLIVPLTRAEMPDVAAGVTAVLSPVLGAAGRDGPVKAVLELTGDRDGADRVAGRIEPATGPGVPAPGWFRERVVIGGDPAEAGVKLCYWITRLGSLSLEDFDTYWAETHAGVARHIPDVVRYVQSLRVDAVASHDGIAEMWWRDVETQQAAMRTRQTRTAMEDERNFIDHGSVLPLVVGWGGGDVAAAAD